MVTDVLKVVTQTAPAFVERTGADNPFDGVDVGSFSAPTFVDIDGDGDFDAFSGESSGIIQCFRNGTPHSGLPPLPLPLTLTGCNSCRAGDRFTVQARLVNPSSRPVPVEAKVGVRLPDGTTMSLFGAHLVIPVPAGFNQSFTLLDIPVPDKLPTGIWTVEGTLLEPQLGETFGWSVQSFEVVP